MVEATKVVTHFLCCKRAKRYRYVMSRLGFQYTESVKHLKRAVWVE